MMQAYWRCGLLLLAWSSFGLLPAQHYRAFWADAFHKGFKTQAQVDAMVERVAAAKGNAIFAEVRHRGVAYYRKTVEPPPDDPDYSPNFDALEYLIEKAHARGIEVHAWFAVTPLWNLTTPPKDRRHIWYSHGPQVKGNENWMTVSSKGKVSHSLDLGHPAAMQYLADTMIDMARNYAIDGIHLDYIRYPEDDSYGYNPVALQRYQHLRNSTATPSAYDPQWSEFRRQQVTALVRQVYLRAIALRPSLKISAALVTWGNGPVTDAEYRTKDAYSRVFQDWRAWMEEGILDLAMPMNYFDQARNPTYLDRWAEFEKARQYRRSLVVGLGPYLNSTMGTMVQVKRAMAPLPSGIRPAGVAFYSDASTTRPSAARFSSEFWKLIGAQIRITPQAPDLPWKSQPAQGHIAGWLHSQGEEWLRDGAEVLIEPLDGRGGTVTVMSDGTGFFGAVDLAPGRYRVKVRRDGHELAASDAREVLPGKVTRFDLAMTSMKARIINAGVTR